MTDPTPLAARLGAEFNPAALARLAALDPTGASGLVRRLFVLLVTVLEQQEERLRDAAARLDFDAVRTSAHSLRSSSLSVGAEAFAADCQTLERAIVQGGGDPADWSARTLALAAEAQRLRIRITAALEDLPA